jgi:hypothetical protein
VLILIGKYPGSVIPIIIKLILLFQIRPIQESDLDNIKQVHALILELYGKLRKLENTEGAHSIEVNKQKLSFSSTILQMQLRAHHLTQEARIGPTGTRTCLPLDTKLFLEAKQALQGKVLGLTR